MREIKFRGMHNGKWIFGYLVEPRVCCEKTKYAIEGPEFDPIPVDEKTVGEYTGLTDKYGVEVYDGDIIEKYGVRWDGWKNVPSDEKRRYVVYRESGGWYVGIPKIVEEQGVYYTSLTYFDSSEYEVIGNIFEGETDERD